MTKKTIPGDVLETSEFELAKNNFQTLQNVRWSCEIVANMLLNASVNPQAAIMAREPTDMCNVVKQKPDLKNDQTWLTLTKSLRALRNFLCHHSFYTAELYTEKLAEYAAIMKSIRSLMTGMTSQLKENPRLFKALRREINNISCVIKQARK